jgi:hypothetical protein
LSRIGTSDARQVARVSAHHRTRGDSLANAKRIGTRKDKDEMNTNGNGHKRAILYARVSTDEQRESGYGLTSQFNDCVEYARRLGYQIVGDTSYKLDGGKLIASTDADAIPAYIEDFTGFSRFDDRPVKR